MMMRKFFFKFMRYDLCMCVICMHIHDIFYFYFVSKKLLFEKKVKMSKKRELTWVKFDKYIF